MDYDATNIIQSELEKGEKLIWAGQPMQGLKLRSADFFMIPFSFLWGGFAIFWEVSVIQSDAPFFFMIFGIPFVIIGFHMIIGRFFVEAKKRKNTFYGVSNERIIIASGLFNKKIKSLNLKTLNDISLSESSNGDGSISFGNSSSFSSMLSGTSWPGMDQNAGPKFDLITNAKHIYQTIRSAQKNAT